MRSSRPAESATAAIPPHTYGSTHEILVDINRHLSARDAGWPSTRHRALDLGGALKSASGSPFRWAALATMQTKNLSQLGPFEPNDHPRRIRKRSCGVRPDLFFRPFFLSLGCCLLGTLSSRGFYDKFFEGARRRASKAAAVHQRTACSFCILEPPLSHVCAIVIRSNLDCTAKEQGSVKSRAC